MEGTKILLVDDEAEFRASTAKVLSRRGFVVDTAASGEEALARVTETRPDLVLLDLKMGGMGGIAALEKIRESHGDLPVIILTGHGDFSSAVEGIRLDILEFLQKPVDPDVLAAKIRALLSRSRPLRESTVRDLMISAESYRKVHVDQTVLDAIRALRAASGERVLGRDAEVGHRSILVVDRKGRLAGVVRRLDVLRMVLPRYLRHSPYSTYFTGMFLARCKAFADRPIGDFLNEDDLVTIAEDTPLMEALALMVEERRINLPVTRGEAVVGMLRDRDLFAEIARLTLGD